MKWFTSLTAALAMGVAGSAFAAGDLSRANVIDVIVELGSDDNGMYIHPSITEFETGQAYKLILTNVDDFKHELALNEMAERVFTRKVEMENADGETMVEVKGNINEVEIGGGQTVEWFIVPVQTMDASEITCELPGHYEAGMKVEVSIF